MQLTQSSQPITANATIHTRPSHTPNSLVARLMSPYNLTPIDSANPKRNSFHCVNRHVSLATAP